MRVSTKWDPAMTHYIGRPSIFGNPFFLREEKDRQLVIDQFEAYARKNRVLQEKIKELPEDAVLGCFCHPLPCHGDVIVKLWKELNNV